MTTKANNKITAMKKIKKAVSTLFKKKGKKTKKEIDKKIVYLDSSNKVKHIEEN